MARNAPFVERTARRTAILRGRIWHTMPGRAPKRRSVFLHMPKCGGTSLSEAMYATVPFNHRIGVIDAAATRRAACIVHFGTDGRAACHEDRETGQLVFDLREAMLLQHMAWDTMLIHGHVLWSERAIEHFGASYDYVTLMRDPVARTLSNYRMGVRTGLHPDDFDAYLEGDVARRQARVYLRYLFGRNDIASDAVHAAVASAKARIARFAVVGFLEDLPAFLDRYRDAIGVRLRVGRLNRAPKGNSAGSGITAEQMRRLEMLCAPDIEIHDHARALHG